jgi:hypothetical protein
VGHLLGHRPADFPRLGRFVLVGLAQQHVSPRSIGPSRCRRVDFLEHGEWQPRASRHETMPRVRVGNEFGHGLLTPPLRPGRQPAPRVGHLPHLIRQIRRNGFHPRLPRDRQARVDEDVAVYLTDKGTRRRQQRPGPAMPDEDRGPPGRAPPYHLGLAYTVGRPSRDRAGQVRDAHLVAPPGQVTRHQVPALAPHQRAMNQQHPSSHAPFVSATPVAQAATHLVLDSEVRCVEGVSAGSQSGSEPIP